MSAPTGTGGTSTAGRPRVVVVGAGIAGVAAAQALRGAGVQVRVLDRGRRPGGRLGTRTVEAGGVEHVVDTGAAYFTVSDPAFAALVDGWGTRGLATPWTDTFTLLGPGGVRGRTTGPQRWSAPAGLRGLVEDLAQGLEVEQSTTVRGVSLADGLPAVDGEGFDAVVLAMPDPQAGRLLDVEASSSLAGVRRVLTSPWTATLSVYAVWEHRWWPELDAGFVADDDLLTLVADDGRRRGDDAPVLVVHAGAPAAREHLAEPEAVIGPVLEHLAAVLGTQRVPEPRSVGVQRWTFASPTQPHEDPYLLTGVGRGLLGVCGDAWGARPRVEQAWVSGRDLGRELGERLAA